VQMCACVCAGNCVSRVLAHTHAHNSLLKRMGSLAYVRVCAGVGVGECVCRCVCVQVIV